MFIISISLAFIQIEILLVCEHQMFNVDLQVDNIRAVSYTHLDVYKRQILYLISSQQFCWVNDWS